MEILSRTEIKKFIAGIIIFCFLLSLLLPTGEVQAASGITPAVSEKETYSDVLGHEYKEALLFVINNGLMSSSQSKFYPDSNLIKGDASAALNSLLGETAGYERMNEVGNLKKGDKYYDTVSVGLRLGYLRQKANGDVYSPFGNATYGYITDIFTSALGKDMSKLILGFHKRNDTLTRGEYAVLLQKLASYITASEPDSIHQVNIDNLYNREFTDGQLKDMLYLRADEIKKKISTIADAVALLDIKYPTLWHSYHIWQGMNSGKAVLRSGEEILNDSILSDAGSGNAGRSDIVTAIAYLLNDNVEIGSLYGFSHTNSGYFNPIAAASYISVDGKYIIFDPVIGMTGDNVSRSGLSLAVDTAVSNLEDYIIHISSTGLIDKVDSIYAITKGQGIAFSDQNGWTTVTSPDVTPLYANQNKNLSNDEYMEKMYGHVKAENINKYNLSNMLGGVTLTIKEAEALVVKSPETIKGKVRTAGDMLIYMLAARMLLKNGDETINAGGYMWHYNSSARQVLSENLGNCGRMANLANFLLEGDYEEIGFILHSYYPGNGGGHVYNYIKYEGKYYIVDFSSYLFNNYDVSSEFNFIVLDKLEDYGKRWNECYGGLAAIIAHTSKGMHLPNVWEGRGYYFPEGAKYQVLYETPKTGYEVLTMPCPPKVPDWTKPQ